MSNETPSLKLPKKLKDTFLISIALLYELFNLEHNKNYVFSMRFCIVETEDDLIATVAGIDIAEEKSK